MKPPVLPHEPPAPGSRPARRMIAELEAQMVAWGQDTRHRAGNLLVAHGFLRLPPPAGGGSSRYRLPWRDRCLELHSFCAGLYGGGRPGFLYIRARRHGYLWRDPEPPEPGRYAEDGLDPGSRLPHRPAYLAAAHEFFTWLDEYRRWRAVYLADQPLTC